MKNGGRKFRIGLAIFWLLLTSSLTLWWMLFAMNLIAQFEAEYIKHRSMLLWEGATLLALLLIGGGSIIYYILREEKQNEKLRVFFSGFTHDIKNRLAGIKIQAESLKSDLQHSPMIAVADRLVTDTSRLQVQVENSLYVGGGRDLELYYEDIQLKNLVSLLQDSWPQIRITLKGDVRLKVDRRVFESVITNIINNSVSHGQATELCIEVQQISNQMVRLKFVDNGQGFHGDHRRLGELFYRHNSASGSGLGLYTCRESVKRLKGNMYFSVDSNSSGISSANKSDFAVQIDLPGALQ